MPACAAIFPGHEEESNPSGLGPEDTRRNTGVPDHAFGRLMEQPNLPRSERGVLKGVQVKIL